MNVQQPQQPQQVNVQQPQQPQQVYVQNPQQVYVQQPQPVMMAPAGAGQDGRDFNGLVVGRWEDDLFGCFNSLVPNCLMCYFCPCVSVSQVMTRMGMGAKFGLAPGTDYIVFVLSLLLLLGLYGLPFIILLFYVRWSVRNMLKIPGNELEDCLCAFFCGPCVMAQCATQVKSYQNGLCSFERPMTLQGYFH